MGSDLGVADHAEDGGVLGEGLLILLDLVALVLLCVLGESLLLLGGTPTPGTEIRTCCSVCCMLSHS